VGILNKKIPSVLGISIITFGVIATTFLVKGGRTLQVNAGPGQDPKNIEVSNISDTSFTITYTTDDAVIGTINVGDNPKNLDIKHIDNRDKATGSINKYQTHIITAEGLKPDSKYFYSITSGDKTYTDDNTYITNTSSSFGDNSNIQTLISGKVISADGNKPNDALVIVKINGAQTLSTLVDKTGNYNIKLNNLKNFDLESLFELNKTKPVNIDIFSGSQNSRIQLSSDQLSNIPAITISSNYDFSEESEVNPKNTRENVKFPEFPSKLKTNSVKITKTITPTKIPTIGQ